jgi:hypothetical protein
MPRGRRCYEPVPWSRAAKLLLLAIDLMGDVQWSSLYIFQATKCLDPRKFAIPERCLSDAYPMLAESPAPERQATTCPACTTTLELVHGIQT